MRELAGVGFWRSTVDEDASGLSHPSSLIDASWPLRERVRVATYLRAGRVLAAYHGYSHCRLECGIPWNYMGSCDLTDGEWVWPEGFSHYVEHHAVKPPAEFLSSIAPRLPRWQPFWWFGAAVRWARWRLRVAAARREAEREKLLPPMTTPLHEAAKNGDCAALGAALQQQSIEQKTRLGETALYLAARAGHVDAVKLLLARGADPKARGSHDITALAETRSAAVAEVLLDAGAEVNPEPRSYFSPITTACSIGDLELLRLLIARGADVNRGDKFRTPLDCARNREVVELLLAHGADAKQGTPLANAARTGDPSLVTLLLERGADVNAPDTRGQTPVFLAAESANGDALVPLLLAAGGSPSTGNDLDDTPLHVACKRTSLVTVDRLLAAGAPVRTRSQRGMTPLHWVAIADPRNESVAVAKRLLSAGAGPIDARDEWGRTPLFIAAERNDVALVQTLLEAGANASIANEQGFTPLSCAERRGFAELARVLTSRAQP